MLNSPMLSIFQHFHAIPLCSPLSPSGSSPDGEPRHSTTSRQVKKLTNRYTRDSGLEYHHLTSPFYRKVGARVLSYIAYLRRSPSLSFIPPVPYPPLRGTFPSRGRQCVGDTAFPLQPPPLRSTSFQRKEGASTRAPSLGRGCRAQRGGVGFLFCGEAASSLPSPLL